jgi:hypothetical protein
MVKIALHKAHLFPELENSVLVPLFTLETFNFISSCRIYVIYFISFDDKTPAGIFLPIILIGLLDSTQKSAKLLFCDHFANLSCLITTSNTRLK